MIEQQVIITWELFIKLMDSTVKQKNAEEHGAVAKSYENLHSDY